MKLALSSLLLGLFFSLSIMPQAHAEEVRLFKAEIEIKEDRSILITETLKVTVEGIQVRQGIVRAFFLNMEFDESEDQTLTYKIETVLRNGEPAKYNVLTQGNLLVLQIYERGVFLEHTEHTFQVTYTVSGYNFDAEMFDTFNWHVTGTGWPLPINLAEAYVKFPALVLPQNVVASGYTNKGDAEVVTRVRGDRVHFTTLDPLTNGEGFSISATWARGFFKGNNLLSIPGDSRENESDLLSIPEEDGRLEIPGVNQKVKADSLDQTLFTPSSIPRYFVDIHVHSDGSVTASESITATFHEGIEVQGLIRNQPLEVESIMPEFAFGASSRLTISRQKQRFFLVAPKPFLPGTHSFTFQYQTPKLIETGSEFDTLNIVLGVPDLKIPVEEIGARIYPPEYMLPNSDLISAAILTVAGQTIAAGTVEENDGAMLLTTESGLKIGEKLLIEFKIPKGFIKN